ncbi:hypothetical protein LCGC14_1105620 [marine sediment metagenome]|uniref:Uncharacterized protein n=1 Tax=marine sediment metagenome TaxID=412755 RepID=A0A0F9MCW5_9ZZZZ
MIILLNGPPNSGKDTAANFIVKILPQVNHAKLSRPLKAAVINIFDLSSGTLRFFNEDSDLESPFLFGDTYRKVQTDLFHHLEAQYGPDILARMFIRYAKKNIAAKYIVLSDCGRTVEAQALVDHFGKAEVILIQLTRRGCNFGNDIREYAKINCDKRACIDNNHDLEIFEAQIKRVLIKWRLLDGE